jgi:hypothetical protein
MEPGRSNEGVERPGAAAAAVFAVGRMTGFLLLTLPALAVLAALALLPQYTQMRQAQWELDCAQANVASLKALRDANERLLAEAPESETLTKRLLLADTAMLPRNEVFTDIGVAGTLPPSLVVPAPTRLPPAPDDWLLRLAQRLGDTGTKRGLFLIAIGAIVTAMFLFSSPSKYKRKAADGPAAETPAPPPAASA